MSVMSYFFFAVLADKTVDILYASGKNFECLYLLS